MPVERSRLRRRQDLLFAAAPVWRFLSHLSAVLSLKTLEG